MRLRFNRDVRKSIADEIKKASIYGGIGLGALGYQITSALMILGAFFWWIACQVIAKLAIEDE